MPLIPIDSADDPRLEIYRNLRGANLCRWSGKFIAEGRLVVERMLAAGLCAESIVAEEQHAADMAVLAPGDPPVYCLSRRSIRQLIGFDFHRGVLACGLRPPPLPLDSLVAPSGPATLVVCPQIQDPENLGAILRSACVLGAGGVLLGRRCADPYSRRVLRVAMGNSFRLPQAEIADATADLLRLRDELQMTLVAAVLDESAEPLETFQPPPRVALLLGEEGHGLERTILDLCQRKVTLQMSRGADSLNVAVASGVFLYHLLRIAPAATRRLASG